MHLDVKLTLRRNLIKAAAAGITLHVDDAQAITGVLTDALERGQKTRLDLGLQVLHLDLQLLLLGTCLFHNLVQLALFQVKGLTTVVDDFLVLRQLSLLLLNAEVSLLDLLVAEFDFQGLVFNLLRQRVILAIVLHVVQLSLITLHAGFGGLYLAFLHVDSLLVLANFILNLLDTGGKTFDFIFQVLYFQRQLASQCTLLVDARERGLQLIEVLQTLFNRHVHRIFLCHNSFVFYVITLYQYFVIPMFRPNNNK